MMGTCTGLSRDLLIAAEGTWGVSAGGGVAAPIAGDGVRLSVQAAFYEPQVNILGHSTAQMPYSRVPRGRIVCHLHRDSSATLLGMGITRGAASLGAPLGSYTITDLNQVGSRVWISAMSARMILAADRRSGRLTVSHDLVAMGEADGPAWTPQTYSPTPVASARDVTLLLANEEPVWESLTLIVENRLIEGPVGTNGTLVSCLAGRQRAALTVTVWGQEGVTYPSDLRNFTERSVVVRLAIPEGAAHTITLNGGLFSALPHSGDADSALRYEASLVFTKPSGSDIIVLT